MVVAEQRWDGDRIDCGSEQHGGAGGARQRSGARLGEVRPVVQQGIGLSLFLLLFSSFLIFFRSSSHFLLFCFTFFSCMFFVSSQQERE
jgi:hypothetical protein